MDTKVVLGLVCLLWIAAPGPESVGPFAMASNAADGSEAVLDHPIASSPELLVIQRQEDVATITLRHMGERLGADSAVTTRFLVGKSDYSHMISSEYAEGLLTVRPTDQLEVGVYDLEITVRRQDGVHRGQVTVFAPLEELIRSGEEAGRSARVSRDTLQHWHHLSTMMPAPRVVLNLPARKYEGEPISIAVQTDPESRIQWTVNGEVNATGDGIDEFVFVPPRPRSYHIGFEAQGEDGAVRQWGHGLVLAAARPAIPWTIPAGVEVTLPGPEGYAVYRWTHEEQVISEERVLAFRHAEPGLVTLVCQARAGDGDTDAFIRLTYQVAVE